MLGFFAYFTSSLSCRGPNRYNERSVSNAQPENRQQSFVIDLGGVVLVLRRDALPQGDGTSAELPLQSGKLVCAMATMNKGSPVGGFIYFSEFSVTCK